MANKEIDFGISVASLYANGIINYEWDEDAGDYIISLTTKGRKISDGLSDER